MADVTLSPDDVAHLIGIINNQMSRTKRAANRKRLVSLRETLASGPVTIAAGAPPPEPPEQEKGPNG